MPDFNFNSRYLCFHKLQSSGAGGPNFVNFISSFAILSPLLQFYLLFCILISITISILFCNLLVRSGAYLDNAEDKNCKREDKKVPKFGPPAWGDKKVQKLNPQGKQIKRGGLKLLVDKSPSNYFTVN